MHFATYMYLENFVSELQAYIEPLFFRTFNSVGNCKTALDKLA